jgi:signal transduction histidine kinase
MGVGRGVAIVEDDGPGPPGLRARLIERFNKPAPGEGFGLGLAIAHALRCPVPRRHGAGRRRF